MSGQEALLLNRARSGEKASSKLPLSSEDALFLSKVPLMVSTGHLADVASPSILPSAREPDDRCVPHPVARLRRITDAIHAGRPLDPNDGSWMAGALDRVLIGEQADAALGLKPGRGERAWRTNARLNERDRLLRVAAGRFLKGLSVLRQAQRLNAELSRYQATAWKRERVCDEVPARHVGTIYEHLWHVLKLHDYVLSIRSIRDILARR